MIYVDALFPCRPPWGGREACHLISDQGKDELLSFAASIGIPWAWYQPGAGGAFPHFDLSPNLRRRAIAAGARPLLRAQIPEVFRRVRAAARGLAPAPDA